MRALKFDPSDWAAIAKGKPFKTVLDEVVVKLPSEEALYCAADGRDPQYALVGFGTEFRITLPPGTFLLKSDAQMFVHVPRDSAVSARGEVLTNMDKRPGLSPAERLVREHLRRAEVAAALKEKARRDADIKDQKRRVDAGLQDEMKPEVAAEEERRKKENEAAVLQEQKDRANASVDSGKEVVDEVTE